MKRYFTKQGTWPPSFWEITALGPSITERFGTHGTRGESRSFICPPRDSVEDLTRRMIRAKEVEGYQEVTPIPPVGPWYSILDPATEQRFLACLEKASEGPAKQFFFNPPASSQAIQAVEQENRMTLPSSLRSFLSYYNGGFIWNERSRKKLEDLKKAAPEEDEFRLKRSVSRPLFSIEEIRLWKQGRVREVIPFCETYNGEVLTVWSVKHPHQESPVFDAWHEAPLWKWEQLYPTFAHLFIDYVELQGAIKTGWGGSSA